MLQESRALASHHAGGEDNGCAVQASTGRSGSGPARIGSRGIRGIAAQIKSVAEDLKLRAVKSGMLATAEIVIAVAAAIRRHRLGAYVLDPVMVATSGDRLLERDAVAACGGGQLNQRLSRPSRYPHPASGTTTPTAMPRSRSCRNGSDGAGAARRNGPDASAHRARRGFHSCSPGP